MSGDRVTGWSVLIVASLVFAFAKYIIIALLVGLTIWCLHKAAKEHNKGVARRLYESEVRKSELRWRANEQNLAQQRGEPYGTYGDYEPKTLPLPIVPREWYDYE